MDRVVVYRGFAEILKADGIEVGRVSDGVAVLVYEKEGRRVYLTRQRRVPMVIAGMDDGVITEAAAGRCDRNLDIRKLAAEEVYEELGISVAPADIRLINDGIPLASSPGYLTERITLAYVEITPEQIAPGEQFGKSDEREVTRRIFIPLDQLDSFEIQDLKTFALIQWFLRGAFKGR
ncbi:MAG: hypothetical protein A2939_05765 [Parcubacteria group bacterium RIFCSPLOWO2_01_FULL_48_18]|nr:MAG: hypothetical protein A2939_05765 [Parcubacteria group bacterium RIFCSPLOWO2_01_FULL_48_18]OHB22586.1 MAG: hypothetical protein A3J67_00795 [Parcubacteria group bacterium RIFCSPHIGHO2_02_FULL_48_10b]